MDILEETFFDGRLLINWLAPNSSALRETQMEQKR